MPNKPNVYELSTFHSLLDEARTVGLEALSVAWRLGNYMNGFDDQDGRNPHTYWANLSGELPGKISLLRGMRDRYSTLADFQKAMVSAGVYTFEAYKEKILGRAGRNSRADVRASIQTDFKEDYESQNWDGKAALEELIHNVYTVDMARKLLRLAGVKPEKFNN